jgi:transposase
MARRTFDVIDICEIFVHWHAGRSKNEIAGSLGLSRNTVRKYLAAAEAAGMTPGGPAVSPERWAQLARAWFPDLADARLRQVTWSAISGHRDYIVAQLAAGVTVATIHQRLANERGLGTGVGLGMAARAGLRLTP